MVASRGIRCIQMNEKGLRKRKEKSCAMSKAKEKLAQKRKKKKKNRKVLSEVKRVAAFESPFVAGGASKQAWRTWRGCCSLWNVRTIIICKHNTCKSEKKEEPHAFLFKTNL